MILKYEKLEILFNIIIDDCINPKWDWVIIVNVILLWIYTGRRRTVVVVDIECI